MDLTTIEKPFGLLDAEAQKALRDAWNAGAAIEIFLGDDWISPGAVVWTKTVTYRVRPTPKPPAIELPWEVIDPRWKWAAMDYDHRVFLYDEAPRMVSDYWKNGDGFQDVTKLFTVIRINVTDWKQSLTKRPE